MTAAPELSFGAGRGRPWALATGVLIALLAAPAAASAHAGPPRATAVVVSDVDADTLVVTATFGLLVSRDGGASWSWLCGAGVGYDSELELPALALFSDGRLAVAAFDGLMQSTRDACGWERAAGDAGSHYFVDVETMPGGQQATLLRTNALGGFRYEVGLWANADGGASFAPVGVSPPDDFVAFDLARSPTDPSRLYLAGRDGDEGSLAEVVMRSDDEGASWSRLAIPGSRPDVKTHAVAHPADPDRLAVWSGDVGEDHRVLFSEDGGQSFEVLIETDEALTGLAFSPGGEQLAVGAASGLTLVALEDGTIQAGADLVVGCLTWTPDGLYACADDAVDGFAVGRSDDGGATFEPVMRLSDPCGPPSCAADDSLTLCEARWSIESEELGACTLSEDAPEPDDQDAGAVATARGCAVGRHGAAHPGAMLLLLAALAVARRRDPPTTIPREYRDR